MILRVDGTQQGDERQDSAPTVLCELCMYVEMRVLTVVA